MNPYTPPQFKLKAYNCPFCNAYSTQNWYYAVKFDRYIQNPPTFSLSSCFYGTLNNMNISQCVHCDKYSIWIDEKMIYPFSGSAPMPNPDLPTDILVDYDEARNILSFSPRSSVALLRLIIQKLCKHLGEKGNNINEDIGSLVKKGLPEKVQKALDSVRVIGNNAVHPGQIDLHDDIETANKLFNFTNIICEYMITQPNKINEFYDSKIPESTKEAIDKRDSK